jgi:lipoprotein-releasing system permease protein
MTGFDRQLRDRIVGFNAHLRIVADGPMEDYREVMDQVRRQPGVRGVAPYVLGRVLVKTEPDEGNPMVDAPIVRGMDPRLEDRVTVLPKSIVAGEFDVKGRGLLVGRSVANRLRVTVGDRLAVYSVRDFEEWQQSRKQDREDAPLADDYVVRGIFDVGYHDFNDQYVVASLANAQDMYRLDDSVHGLIVMLDDPDQAEAVRRDLEPVLAALDLPHPQGFQITTWMEENSTILEALIVEKGVMYYLLFFIVLVAAFGITSALITFVVQKTREIGMLKALGGTRGQVVWLFLSQSLIVGVLGVISGFGLGMLAVTYRNEFLFFMRRVTGFELFPAQIYNFSELPALIVPGDIAVICGGSLVICLLAGLVPAWNAGRLKPVEALRYE